MWGGSVLKIKTFASMAYFIEEEGVNGDAELLFKAVILSATIS